MQKKMNTTTNNILSNNGYYFNAFIIRFISSKERVALLLRHISFEKLDM